MPFTSGSALLPQPLCVWGATLAAVWSKGWLPCCKAKMAHTSQAMRQSPCLNSHQLCYQGARNNDEFSVCLVALPLQCWKRCKDSQAAGDRSIFTSFSTPSPWCQSLAWTKFFFVAYHLRLESHVTLLLLLCCCYELSVRGMDGSPN